MRGGIGERGGGLCCERGFLDVLMLMCLMGWKGGRGALGGPPWVGCRERKDVRAGRSYRGREAGNGLVGWEMSKEVCE